MDRRVIAAAFVLLLGVGLAVGFLVGASNQRTVTSISTTTTTRTFSMENGQLYMNEPAVYSNLGYPKITYNDNSPYLSSKANYTFTYHTPKFYDRVGSVTAPVIGLIQAVGLAAQALVLNPSNFTLAVADFVPGDITNGSVSLDPSWLLFFAESQNGYWAFGSCGSGDYSAYANVDALKGSVVKSESSYCSGANLTNLGSFDLRITSPEALRQIRTASIPGVPAALEKNGTLYFMEPRIVSFGPSSNNIAFQSPLNASYSGLTRLCWVVQMNSPVPQYGYQGTFAVDAETGKLVSGWAYQLYPNMHYEYVSGSPIFNSAKNLDVSAETFRIDAGAVGIPGSGQVVIPNIVIVRPSSTGTIALNFSSNSGSETDVTLSFVNLLPGFQTLLPNNLPPAVTIQPSSTFVLIPGNGQTRVNLVISADQSAPIGTYLIGLEAASAKTTAEVYFFLSVWNGQGQWPAPPYPR